ncbi:MAG: hypothetical protein KJ621_20440, partial [Proteobacteria bacterium]|nr:hypothetical protein [Pseudomonadota bacterium]
SVAFNDDNTRRLFEHRTMDTDKRISALAELKSAGIRTSALVCPVMPFITDAIELVERLEHHTVKIWLYGLSILDRSEINWQIVKRILEMHFPGLKEKTEAAIFSKEHPYWGKLRRDLIALQESRPMDLSIHL